MEARVGDRVVAISWLHEAVVVFVSENRWEKGGAEGQRSAEEAKLYLPPRYASPSSIITV